MTTVQPIPAMKPVPDDVHGDRAASVRDPSGPRGAVAGDVSAAPIGRWMAEPA
jgi:hypothetical protein